jgi:rubrerythrin
MKVVSDARVKDYELRKAFYFNVLAEHEDDKIREHCTIFYSELKEKGKDPEAYAEAAIRYKKWLTRTKKILNQMKSEFGEYEAIREKIRDFLANVELGNSKPLTNAIFEDVLKILEIREYGHHLLETRNSRTYFCASCNQVFSNFHARQEIPYCQTIPPQNNKIKDKLERV